MKKLWIALLACMSFVCMSLGIACSKEEDTTKLAFNEGYLEEIILGEPIMLDEYIDPNLTEDYTAILTCDATGQERDLKELVQWTTDKPGMYTLTYTVKSGDYKGTISTKINVVVADANWTYSNPTLVLLNVKRIKLVVRFDDEFKFCRCFPAPIEQFVFFRNQFVGHEVFKENTGQSVFSFV